MCGGVGGPLPTVEHRYSPDADNVSAARRFVIDTVVEWGVDSLDVVRLLVDELVANAVRHAATDVLVRVHLAESVLRVEVEDGTGAEPQLLQLGVMADHGRGLHLVDELSDRWGFEPTRDGKVVWCELPALPLET